MKKIIIFNPGCYGRFLDWCIKTVATDCDIVFPFEETGSSHAPNNASTILDYKNIYCVYKKEILDPTGLNIICKHSCILNETNDTKEFYEYILNNSEIKFINLYSTDKDTAWVLNNKYSKIDSYLESMFKSVKGQLDLRKLLTNKPKSRRVLSKILNKDYNIELERTSNILLNQNKPHIFDCHIQSLKNNFFVTLMNCMDFLELKPKKSIDDIDFIYIEWLKRQKHTNKDQLLTYIVNKFEKNESFYFQNLTLIDEALLISQLENKGYEFDLKSIPEEFPKSIHELKGFLL